MVNDFISKYRKEIVWAFLAILVIMFGYLFVLSIIKPLYQDEGVFLTIGRGIATGRQPYLDFWDHKTPGIYYLWALFYPIFGTNIILYKIFVWLVNFITAPLVFGISEKMRKESGKFSVLIFLCSLVFLEGNYLGAGPFLGLFLAASVWFLFLRPQKGLAAFVGGALLAGAIIFKQTAILNILPIVIYVVASGNFINTILFFEGLVFPIWFSLWYLSNNHSVNEFWSQAFGASTKSYPPDPIKKVLLSLSQTFSRIWWVFAGIIPSFSNFRKNAKEHWLILFMILIPSLTFFARPYPHYWLQVLPFVSVLSGIGFFLVIERLFKNKHHLMVVLLFVLIIVSFCFSVSWFAWVTSHWNRPKEKEQTKIVNEIKGLRGKYILTENRFTGYGFLTGRRPLTKYLYLTEVNEGESARKKTLEALERESGIVALWPKDQTYVYAKEIGDYLVNHFRKIGEFPALDLVIFYKD